MIKLLIISFTFQKEQYTRRWKLLSESYSDVDVTLLAPADWEWGSSKTLTYGHVDKLLGFTVNEERFHIHLIDAKVDRFGDWHSKLLKTEILNVKPDIVYFIGGHTSPILIDIIKTKLKFKLNNMKIMVFSMRGHTPTIDFKKNEKGVKKYINTLGKILILGPRQRLSFKYCDAVFCHYPEALKAFRVDGFEGSIYIQTQVGVNPEIFYPSQESRRKIRKKYNIGDAYLFGSASRFHYSKGLSEIIKALPKEGNWKYLIIGWGREDEVNIIKSEIKARHLENKIILTGFINNVNDMAEHWNALDCAIHAPLTTLRWEETFSLSLVQAMITGLPIIGSSSGSVPYQIGKEGLIVPEGDVEELSKIIKYIINNPDLGVEIGKKMRMRALSCFSIYHLNNMFYDTIIDVMLGIYDRNKIDMTEYRTYNHPELISKQEKQYVY